MYADLDIPPLWCPLDLHVREGQHLIQDESRRWLKRHGLDERSLLRAAATNVGFLSCSWAPRASDEGAQLLADWLVWALLFDDYYCDTGPYAGQPSTFNPLITQVMTRALYPVIGPSGEPAFDGFASALADLTRRITAVATPELAHLFFLGHYRWAVGAMCGVSDRASATLRTVEEHLLIRPADAADLQACYLIEIAEGTMLPAFERLRPEVRAFVQAAGILMAVPSDLASYRHEQHQRCLESNIVHVLARENGYTAQEAVEHACALLESIMDFFLTAADRLRAGATQTLDRYIDQLCNFVRGTYEWQRSVPRYTTVLDISEDGSPASARQPGDTLHEITLTPSRIFPNRPKVISWWWDVFDSKAA